MKGWVGLVGWPAEDGILTQWSVGIATPDLNFQSLDSGLSISQSRDSAGSRRDWRSIVKTTKIATMVTVFGSLFLNYKCVRSCYGFSADVLLQIKYYSASADNGVDLRTRVNRPLTFQSHARSKVTSLIDRLKYTCDRCDWSKFQKTVSV